ncbi:MAG: hypothetical protein WD599_04180 [Balneolaceae bacterium]
MTPIIPLSKLTKVYLTFGTEKALPETTSHTDFNLLHSGEMEDVPQATVVQALAPVFKSPLLSIFNGNSIGDEVLQIGIVGVVSQLILLSILISGILNLILLIS